MVSLKYGRFILDKCGAPKLSDLTSCGAPPIDEPPNHLGSFVLNSILSITYNDPIDRLVLMFGRRVEHAIREYRTARELFLDYVDRLLQTNSHFLLAMRATTHFEQCIGSAYQAVLLQRGIMKSITPNHELPNPSCDQEEKIRLIHEKIRKIWNRSKHFDEDLTDPKKLLDPQITAPVWITNEGIEATTATITFLELQLVLIDLLHDLKIVTEDLPKQFVENYGHTRTPSRSR